MKRFFKRLLSASYVPLALIALAGIAWFISMVAFPQESLRLDESQSIWQTSRSLPATLKTVAQDVHVPLYHVILHHWMILFGNSTEAIRALSMVFFTLSIPFIYLLARTILSKRWSLFLVGMVVLSPFVNWYANEARMYTLLTLMSVASQYFFIRIMRGKKGSWPWYALTAVLGVYSHYFFFFNLITQAIFYLTNKKKFPAKTFSKFFLTATLVAAAIAPWIYYFISQGSGSSTRPHLSQPSAIDFFNVYSQFLFGFQSININTLLIACWPLTVIIAFFLVRRHIQPSNPTKYMVVSAFVPVIIAFLASFVTTPFFLSRYMIAAAVPLYILVVWFISQHPKKHALLGAAGAVAVVGLLFFQQTKSPDTPVRENYKQLVSDVTAHATPRDVIAMSSPFTVYPFEYYYKGVSSIKTIPLWDRQNAGPPPGFDLKSLPKQVDVLKKGHDYIYLVLSYDQGYEQDIRVFFRDHYELVSHKVYSKDLELLVYKVNYSDPVSFSK